MNAFFAFFPFTAALIVFALVLFVLTRDPRSVLNRVLLFVTGILQLMVLNTLVPAQYAGGTFTGSLVVLVSAVIIVTTFFPRLLLSHRLKYQDKLQQFIQDMPVYSSMGGLLDALEVLLTKTVKVKSYQMILLDETIRSFSMFRSCPEEGTRFLPNLRPDSPVMRLFTNSDRPYLEFNRGFDEAEESELEREARRSLAVFDPDFCFPLMMGDVPFGLLLIGAKTNGRPVTPNNLKLLTQLVRSLGLAVNQMRLKQHLLLAEELELLGRMSRGMSHDLNNLLTPLSTFLQLFQDGATKAGPGRVARRLPSQYWDHSGLREGGTFLLREPQPAVGGTETR